MIEIKCKKDFNADWFFVKDSFYILVSQNDDFCLMINKDGKKYAFTRNKVNNRLIPYWIEDYFDYSSPVIIRKVIIEKTK